MLGVAFFNFHLLHGVLMCVRLLVKDTQQVRGEEAENRHKVFC